MAYYEARRSRLPSVIGALALGAGLYGVLRALGGARGVKRLSRNAGKALGRFARRDFVLSSERFPFLYGGREDARPYHFRLLGRRSIGWRPLFT